MSNVSSHSVPSSSESALSSTPSPGGSSSCPANKGTAGAPTATAASTSSVNTPIATSKDVQPLFSPICDLPIKADLPEYTFDEVYAHNHAESYWVVIDGHIYDVTKYGPKHPGGCGWTFDRGHGTDVALAFNEFHGRKEKNMTRHLLIGRIKPGSPSNRTRQSQRPITTSELELEDWPLNEIEQKTEMPNESGTPPKPN